jgi:tetratricopeptide (TPR) repeat protein
MSSSSSSSGSSKSNAVILAAAAAVGVATLVAVVFSARRAGTAKSKAGRKTGAKAAEVDDSGSQEAVPTAAAREREPAGGAAAASVAEGGDEGGHGGSSDVASPSEATEGDLKKKFDDAVKQAKAHFKAGEFKLAAAQYTVALGLCDGIAGYGERRGALYNNRAAMHEKAGDTALCLLDCTLCITEDPHHRLARVRKARVYEKLEKYDEALTELCAHMLIDRDTFRNAMQEGKTPQQPQPPERLEAVMKKLADVEADRIYEAKMSEKVTEGLPSNYATYEVLRAFESFAAIEQKCRGVSDAAIGEEISSAKDLASLVSSYMDRAMVRATRRRFEESCKDVDAAYGALQAAREEHGEEKGWEGVPKDVLADVMAWYGTFLHLKQDLEGAQAAYELACEVKADNPDVWIKRAGVAMDKEDYDAAEKLFERAMDVDVKCATTYMFRAQIHAYRGNMASAMEDIDSCLALNPGHTAAYGRKVTMYMQLGDAESAGRVIDEGLAVSPNSSELLVIKGEYLYGMAFMQGDANGVQQAMSYFDRAMSADARNPAAYVNKGLALINLAQDVEGGIALLEKAILVDPRYQPAMAQLGQMKIAVARTFEDAQEAIRLFDDAIALSRDRSDLGEICQCKVAAHAKIRAAKALGFHNLM